MWCFEKKVSFRIMFYAWFVRNTRRREDIYLTLRKANHELLGIFRNDGNIKVVITSKRPVSRIRFLMYRLGLLSNNEGNYIIQYHKEKKGKITIALSKSLHLLGWRKSGFVTNTFQADMKKILNWLDFTQGENE